MCIRDRQKELLHSGTSIFSYSGKDAESFAESFDENVVYSLKYERNRETAMHYEIEDKKVIRQVFDALSRIQVTGDVYKRQRQVLKICEGCNTTISNRETRKEIFTKSFNNNLRRINGQVKKSIRRMPWH